MVTVFIANAFCKNHSGGNKAGVVVQAGQLGKQQKTEIAARLGFSETAFVSPSNDTDFQLEYFTPKGEVPLCGHATIATFAVLGNQGLLGGSFQKSPSGLASHYSIGTKAGNFGIEIAPDGMIRMEQSLPEFYEVLEPSALDGCFDTGLIDKKLPIQIVSTGLRDILVPVDSVQHLTEAVPNFGVMSAVSRQKEVVGLHAFSLVHSDSLTAICRNFAPLYGIDEESATGTSNCALAAYLFRQGIKKEQYVFEQGHILGSISQIVVRLESQKDVITKVSVGGYGDLAGKETIHL